DRQYVALPRLEWGVFDQKPKYVLFGPLRERFFDFLLFLFAFFLFSPQQFARVNVLVHVLFAFEPRYFGRFTVTVRRLEIVTRRLTAALDCSRVNVDQVID